MNLRDQHIVKQEIVLPKAEHIGMGPNLVLEDCKIISNASAGNLIIAGLTMNNGVFEQKLMLKNHSFSDAHFNGTTFLGRYVGCDFGDWDNDGNSSFRNCDLTNAKLDYCRLILCPLETIKLPKWPCFTISHPANAHAYVISHSWPENLGRMLKICVRSRPECVGSVNDAARCAKEDGISVEKVRELINGIPGLIIVD